MSFLVGAGRGWHPGEGSGVLPEASVSLGVHVSLQLTHSPELRAGRGRGSRVDVKQGTCPSSVGSG